jgi:hypothetical protein
MSPVVVIGFRPLKAAAAVVAPVPPFAKGSAVPDKVTAKVPEEVMGDPDTDKNDGTVKATEVTVPLVAGAAQTGIPPETVKTFPVAPVAIEVRMVLASKYPIVFGVAWEKATLVPVAAPHARDWVPSAPAK